jgi:hypothetical protein
VATEPTSHSRAASLIRQALAILDESGESTAAAYLQHALDILPEGPMDDGGESRLRSHIPVIRAMGGALALVATMIGRGGDVSLDEFSRLLGIYAVATSESANDEGMVLAYWASMVRDVAEAQPGSPAGPA